MSFFLSPYSQGALWGQQCAVHSPNERHLQLLLYLYVYNHVIQMYFIAVGDNIAF